MQILKRTLPVHDDYEVLQSTIATIEEALNRVNDMMTQQENSKRVMFTIDVFAALLRSLAVQCGLLFGDLVVAHVFYLVCNLST